MSVFALIMIASLNPALAGFAEQPYNKSSSGWSDSDASSPNPDSNDNTSPRGESPKGLNSPEDSPTPNHDSSGCNAEVSVCSNSPIESRSSCDAQSSTCSDNPAQCDPLDQSCNEPTCDPTDTACQGRGEPNCDIVDPDCNGDSIFFNSETV